MISGSADAGPRVGPLWASRGLSSDLPRIYAGSSCDSAAVVGPSACRKSDPDPTT